MQAKDPQNPFASVLARQQVFNRRTRANAEHFGPHRRRVTTAIAEAARPSGAPLCVLGAGNANDLDLTALTETFPRIHLVDLDAEALGQVSDRHPELNRVVECHGETDLGGIATLLDKLARPGSALEIDELIAAAKRVSPPGLSFRRGVVASTCVLTQLMNSAVAALGASHPRLLEVLDAIRIGHLRLIVDLTAPGGTGLLFTDVASSDDTPQIGTTPESDLPRLATQLVREKKVFLGVDPNQIEQQLRGDPYIVSRATATRRIGFWTWRISEHRTFLVYAISFCR